MNPLAVKAIAIIVLAATLIGGYAAWHHHVFEQGVTQEKDRRDKIDAQNTAKAQAELLALNAKMRALQTELTTAMADLAVKQQELQNAKAESDRYQSDLRAGRERLRVLVAGRSACPSGPAAGSGTAAVDQGASVTADLDPEVAGNLVWLTTEGDTAIRRLNGCITAYDAVKAAADQEGK